MPRLKLNRTLKLAAWAATLLIGLSAFVRFAGLPWMARMLDVTETPVPADVVVVPSTDFLKTEAQAIAYAALLVHQNYAPYVLLEQGAPYYGRTACDFWVPIISRRTRVEERVFQCVDSPSLSASERAWRVTEVLRTRHIKRVLVVTPAAASRRLRRAFRKAAPGIEFHMVRSPEDKFNPASWWRSRQDAKALIAEIFELLAPSDLDCTISLT
jgi:hypothetical protein